MRYPLVRAVGVRVVPLGAEDDVVLLAGAVGAVVGGKVRRAQQELAELFRQPVRLGVEGLLVVAERSALGHERLGALGVAPAAPLTDLLRDHLDAGSELVAPGAEGALLLVELDDAVDRRRRVAAPPGEPGAEGVGFGAEAAQVEHGPRR